MRRLWFALLGLPLMFIPLGQASGLALRSPARVLTVGRTTVHSLNWSGYAAFKNGVTFTDAKGSWVQPTAHCTTSKKTLAAFWVGIDGFNSNSVEQTGTDADCNGLNSPSYYGWYELYPNPPVYLSKTTYPVRAGDTISGEVSVSGSTFTLKLHSSRGWTFQTSKSVSGTARSSAEWVAEAPARCTPGGCTVLPLTNFGTVSYTGSYATGGGHTGSISYSGWNNDEIVMVTKSGTVRAQPSGLGSSGTAFTVQWKHA